MSASSCLSRSQASLPHCSGIVFDFCFSHITHPIHQQILLALLSEHHPLRPLFIISVTPSMPQPGSPNEPPTWSLHVYSCPLQSGFYTAAPMISLKQRSYHIIHSNGFPSCLAHGLFMSWALWTSLQSFPIALPSPH